MILDKIANSTKKRVETLKKSIPFDEIKQKSLDVKGYEPFIFEKSLKGRDISFICEVKKASPSKGIISEEFDYKNIAKDYEKAGAAAISVLTEPEYFLGDDRYLKEIAEVVSTPILRKDFTIDPYQIYEARVIGASAVLLICRLLAQKELKEYISIADSLGLSTLVEAHDEDEVKKALNAGARVLGVNNRDLRTFSVDINNSLRLRHLVPDNVIFISESGITSACHIDELRKAKVDAVLIGERFMVSSDRVNAISKLRSGNV